MVIVPGVLVDPWGTPTTIFPVERDRAALKGNKATSNIAYLENFDTTNLEVCSHYGYTQVNCCSNC